VKAEPIFGFTEVDWLLELFVDGLLLLEQPTTNMAQKRRELKMEKIRVSVMSDIKVLSTDSQPQFKRL
jgi:hypothetical protein